MNKIEFKNNQEPAINANNLNELQNNMENAINNMENAINNIQISEATPSSSFGQIDVNKVIINNKIKI